jgi:hypothetical protein
MRKQGASWLEIKISRGGPILDRSTVWLGATRSISRLAKASRIKPPEISSLSST